MNELKLNEFLLYLIKKAEDSFIHSYNEWYYDFENEQSIYFRFFKNGFLFIKDNDIVFSDKLVLSNIVIGDMGKGKGTLIIDFCKEFALANKFPLIIESVINDRFFDFLLRRGFVVYNNSNSLIFNA